MSNLQQLTNPAQTNGPVIVNENFESSEHVVVYAKDPETTSGLTWGYLGGRWGGVLIAAGTLALTGSSTNYIVVEISTSLITVSTSATNWNDGANYARVFKVTTNVSAVTAVEDHRAGPQGVHGGGASGSSVLQTIAIACGDETSPLTTGTAKATFRMPYGFDISEVRASLTAAQTAGSIFTVDINESGSTILSTKLTIDNNEKTSKTALTPAVISDAALADDAEITIDIDQIGTSGAAGLKIYFIGTRA